MCVHVSEFSLFFCPFDHSGRSLPSESFSTVSTLVFVHYFVVTLITTITALGNCTSSEKKENILGALNVGLHFFFLIWNKDMATHSYLYRRAKIIQIDM